MIGVSSSLPIGVKSDSGAGSGELLLFCMIAGGQPELERLAAGDELFCLRRRWLGYEPRV